MVGRWGKVGKRPKKSNLLNVRRKHILNNVPVILRWNSKVIFYYLQQQHNLKVFPPVLEDPVNVLEEDHSVETDVILKNLGNFPIHMRQSQQWKSRLVPKIHINWADTMHETNV